MKINSIDKSNFVYSPYAKEKRIIGAIGGTIGTINTYQRVNLKPNNSHQGVAFSKDKNADNQPLYIQQLKYFMNNLYPPKF